MTTGILNIVENEGGGPMNQGAERPIRKFGFNSQDVAVGAASVQSAAIAAGNKEVRLCADVNCRVATGANPTATSTSERIVANAPERFRVTPGDKIAVIED